MIQKDVPIFSEWVGTTDGLVNAEIRSQVTGIFIDAGVPGRWSSQKGDLLFQIDPRKFQAALDQAAGDLKSAQAHLTKTKLDVARERAAGKEGAISQKEFQDSVQANRAAGAAVESAKAAVEQAKLNLEWTKVLAPINGVVGIAKAQVGDLIDANSALTSMSTLDPIRVYFPISEQEYLKLSGSMTELYETTKDLLDSA